MCYPRNLAPFVGCLLLLQPLFGQQLDPSFGVNGQAVVNGSLNNYVPSAFAEGEDGSLLIGGTQSSPGYTSRWFAYRCDESGFPITGFNGNGIAFMNPCISEDLLVAAGIDPQGRCILGGYENWLTTFKGTDQAVIGRLLPNGQADTSFGDTLGMQYYLRAGSSGTNTTAMAVLPSSRINVGCYVGSSNPGGTSFQLDVNGEFAGIQYPQDHSDGSGWPMYLAGRGCSLSDGGIVMVGKSSLSITTGPSRLLVLKLDSTLAPYPGFGNEGWYSELYPSQVVTADQVCADGLGRLVVMANRHPGSERYLFRILPNGTKDLSFGINGEVLLGGYYDDIDAAADGRIVLCSSISGGQFNVTMFDASGQLMTSFGSNGVYTLPFTIYGGRRTVNFSANDQALFLTTNSTYGGQRFALFKVMTDIASAISRPPDGLRVYPNPTEGEIIIDGINGRYSSLELVDVVGKVVRRMPVGNGERITGNLSDLAIGRYILVLHGNSGQRSHLVVQKL